MGCTKHAKIQKATLRGLLAWTPRPQVQQSKSGPVDPLAPITLIGVNPIKIGAGSYIKMATVFHQLELTAIVPLSNCLALA